jgi:UDP-N-acetylglucosamine 2-epimerase
MGKITKSLSLGVAVESIALKTKTGSNSLKAKRVNKKNQLNTTLTLNSEKSNQSVPNRLRVMTIVGTRPELIRLSRIIPKLDQYCEHLLVHTGQNYDFELNDIFFKELCIRKPDIFLDASGSNGIQTIGQILIGIEPIMREKHPDAVLILGDTNSSLAAIAAKRLHIPIFHMEAGNRCFNYCVPEEVNRKIVDHIADINLPYSSLARENLLAEGFPSDQTIKTGSPLREVLEYYRHNISKSLILKSLKIKQGQYFLVSAHREENVDLIANLKKLVEILNLLATDFNLPVIVSTHPRMRSRLNELKIEINPLVRFEKPFGFFDYISLQKNARCVMSDSGTITEEASILNFPALNLRNEHERLEGMEEGAVIMVGLSSERVMQGLEILKNQKRGMRRDINLPTDYSPSNVSEKILRIILSYTNFVNRKVWGKI